MRVEVTVPEDHVGGVIGDLNARRGMIVETQSGISGHEVVAHAPLAEMFGYVGDLRSLSSGRASFSMSLDHYGVVPASLVSKLIINS